MSFLRGFDHDIFVSYAHVDNATTPSDERGWVEEFDRWLTVCLLQRLGQQVDVWRDRRLTTTQLFDDVIKDAIRHAGVMVCLLSKGYLASAYCQQELSLFAGKAGTDALAASVGHSTRICPVLLADIDPEEWPSGLKGRVPAVLHDDDGWPFHASSPAFARRVRGLASDLAGVLELMRSTPGQTGASPSALRPRIFVGCAADDMRPALRRVTAEIEDHGGEVVRDIPPPFAKHDHERAVKRAIEDVLLSVHLVGKSAGEPLDVDRLDDTYPAEQIRIGVEARDHSQLVLVPQEIPTLAECGAIGTELGARIEGKQESGRLEIARVAPSQMPATALAMLTKLERTTRRARAEAGNIVFVDVHVCDLAHVAEPLRALAGRRMEPVTIPSTDHAPSDHWERFEDNLERARLFLIVYGAVAHAWVEYRIREARKLVSSRRLRTKVAVYLTPPGKPAARLEFGVPVVDATEGFEPVSLDRVLG